jgi:hypothetical protein
MSTTAVPAALTFLVAEISAQPACTGDGEHAFGLYRGDPPGVWPVDDGIIIGAEVARKLSKLAIVGGGGYEYLREDFTIKVEIGVYRGGDDEPTVETRLWALVNAVESAVRVDLSLGGSVSEAWPTTVDYTSAWSPDGNGRRAFATLDIDCWAAI